MSEGQRRLVAIMFTDMVGYTALGQRNESLSLALVEEQRKLIRPIINRHEGREVKTIGDAFLIEFPNAVDAVRCAYDIQRVVREFNLSLAPEKRIHLRIGVHVGEVVEAQGDISGDAVNVASRIEPLAEDGGICLSRQTYDHVHNKVDFHLSNLGSKSLKNVSELMEVYKVILPWEQEPVSAPSAQPDRRRIAVLPFASMSPDPQDEYFADGMTEELIDRLAQVKSLRVIARTSVMSYKGEKKKASQIAKELDVSSLVEGSVRKAGNRVRVTVQLVSAESEEHLWSSHYDKDLDDIFAVQSDIAERVAGELKVRVLESEKETLEKKPTEVPEAYEKYLLAKHRRSRDPFERIRDYEAAIELDPRFALAYASLAMYYIVIAGDFIPMAEGASKADELITKALQLDENLSEAWTAKGVLAYQYSWDAEEAERCYKRALELNPSDSHAHGWYAATCLSMGKREQALELALKARSIDPFPREPGYLGMFLGSAGKVDEAVRECDRVRKLYPGATETHNIIALTLGLLGKNKEAAEELDELRAEIESLRASGVKGWTAGAAPGILSLNALNYAITGQTEKARTLLQEAEMVSVKGHVDLSALGTLYFAAGASDKGFELFERALEERDGGVYMYMVLVVQLMGHDRKLSEAVLHNPRFASMLEKMGLRFEV